MCPSAKIVFGMLSWPVPAVSYTYNDAILKSFWCNNDPKQYNASCWNRRMIPDKVHKPAMTLTLADGPAGSPGWWNRIQADAIDQVWFTQEGVWGRADNINSGNVRYWHNNNLLLNMLMVDYHVEMGISRADGMSKHYEDPIWYESGRKIKI